MAGSFHSRRSLLGQLLAGLVGGSLAKSESAQASQEETTSPGAPGVSPPAKRCVVLWMNGGPSQFETFDPKPGVTTGGPTRAIDTAVSGLKIASELPQIAQRLGQLCILRNVTSAEGEHERAQYFLHTGFRMVPAFPRPAFGSVISHTTAEMDFPKYVLLGGRGFGPAYCGPDHASFDIANVNAARQLLQQVQRRKEGLQLLDQLGQAFDQRNQFEAIERRRSMLRQIQRLITTNRFRAALDVADESTATRKRYGSHQFGERCLVARRLLERGVPFVEVQLDGWDTHVDNFAATSRLAAAIDGPWAALLDDLAASGLWQDTLLVWMGEFGRTPLVNGQNGRDHFPAVTPVVLGGGGILGGQAVGDTGRNGSRIEGTAYQVADVAATILNRLGVAPDQPFTTTFGSPTQATDNGKVIAEAVV